MQGVKLMITGRCRCGAIHYEAVGEPFFSALCHCADCRKSAGAPMVGWAMFPEGRLKVTGDPVRYQSSGDVVRDFCGTCGSGLFWRNTASYPGMVDIQTATLDDEAALPPAVHVHYVEALPWMGKVHELPKFDRLPNSGS
ncbi:glutathione-dependent formaldehyde-activating GFA [Sphingobium chlorophenolicum L-1]|uniref:Glutathione-dependent formaldehyde-activating GFA n=2 Tax=Sphingobium chlorophenolicum TaxID=46429 RepID=F6EYV8_SPHCR|nr:glutathione-dependent formaldehyde-activating GFA [Sphingobium chlorophenolicum L-1]